MVVVLEASNVHVFIKVWTVEGRCMMEGDERTPKEWRLSARSSPTQRSDVKE